MAAEIDAYQDALTELQKAESAAAQLAADIGSIGIAVQRWRSLGISGLEGIDLSLDRSATSVHLIEASRWPSIQHVADVLMRYHQALSRTQATWAGIPLERRTGLVPPP